MRVNKFVFFALVAVAAIGSYVIFTAKSEGLFNNLILDKKLPSWMSFLEKKA